MPKYTYVSNRIVGFVFLVLCGACAAVFFHAEATEDHPVIIWGITFPWAIGCFGLMFAILSVMGLLALLGYVRLLTKIT